MAKFAPWSTSTYPQAWNPSYWKNCKHPTIPMEGEALCRQNWSFVEKRKKIFLLLLSWLFSLDNSTTTYLSIILGYFWGYIPNWKAWSVIFKFKRYCLYTVDIPPYVDELWLYILNSNFDLSNGRYCSSIYSRSLN